jgi:ParB-like chromosome segregation protein Spo0J
MEEVPVVVRAHLTPAQCAEARLADNRVAEFGWDFEALRDDLTIACDLPDFEVELTGFDPESILPKKVLLDDKGMVKSEDDEESQEGTGELNLGRGAHTCPRCNFNFGEE